MDLAPKLSHAFFVEREPTVQNRFEAKTTTDHLLAKPTPSGSNPEITLYEWKENGSVMFIREGKLEMEIEFS